MILLERETCSCQDAIRWNKKHWQCFVHTTWAEEEFVEHGQNNKSKLHCGVWFKTMPSNSQARPLIDNKKNLKPF